MFLPWVRSGLADGPQSPRHVYSREGRGWALPSQVRTHRPTRPVSDLRVCADQRSHDEGQPAHVHVESVTFMEGFTVPGRLPGCTAMPPCGEQGCTRDIWAEWTWFHRVVQPPGRGKAPRRLFRWASCPRRSWEMEVSNQFLLITTSGWHVGSFSSEMLLIFSESECL